MRSRLFQEKFLGGNPRGGLKRAAARLFQEVPREEFKRWTLGAGRDTVGAGGCTWPQLS